MPELPDVTVYVVRHADSSADRENAKNPEK
jgi:hypothetical protein